MPAAHFDKERIALCCPNGSEMADRVQNFMMELAQQRSSIKT